MTTSIDELLYLTGDEDTGVGVECRKCDRGGMPIIYYLGIDKTAYKGSTVIVVTSVTELIAQAFVHVSFHELEK